MLKVNEQKLLDEIKKLNDRLASIESQAKAQVESFNISDNAKTEIANIIIKEYSADIKLHLDYLLQFIDEVEDEDASGGINIDDIIK